MLQMKRVSEREILTTKTLSLGPSFNEFRTQSLSKLLVSCFMLFIDKHWVFDLNNSHFSQLRELSFVVCYDIPGLGAGRENVEEVASGRSLTAADGKCVL